MKILFSPSEEKRFIYTNCDNLEWQFLDSLLFGAAARVGFVKEYISFLKSDDDSKMSVLGSNNVEVLNATINLDMANTVESIHLYNGVAFKALDLYSLPSDSISFIYENVIIFSNLFGPIRASDKIPFYKLKQGKKFLNKTINVLYNDFKKELDNYLTGELILDLRAEFYLKAYKLNMPHIRVEFFKNGKKSTHFSKHYKGVLLRHMALNKTYVEPFKILDIKKDDLAKILQYDVSDSIIV